MEDIRAIWQAIKDGLSHDLEAIYIWCDGRRVTVVELFNPTLMAWTAVGLLLAPREQLDASPLYQRLFSVVPFAGWIVFLFGVAVLYAVAAMRRSVAIQRIALTLTASFWMFIGTIVYIVSDGTIHATALYALIAFISVFRAGSLSFSEDT